MAKQILTGELLSRNDISILKQLFEQSFDYYINHNSPFFTDYLEALRTVAGLGFTAALVDRSLLSVYQHYLGYFMAQKEGNFRENQGARVLIAQAIAEMVNTAVVCFYALKFPRYYEDFIAALHYTMAKIPGLRGQQAEAERILALLVIR